MNLPFHASDYLKWDERLERTLRPDDLIRSLADDLMRDGNLDLSLQRAFRWGAEGQSGDGLNDLLQRLREQQQELLSRYDFGSSLDDLRERLDDIVRREAEAVDDRLQSIASAPNADDLPPALSEMMLNRLDKLSSLPNGLGDQVDALKDYEFIDQRAGSDFQQLVEDMQKGVLDALFNSVKGSMQNASESAEATREFLRDINDAFEAEARGEQPDLDKLNNRWAEQLGGRVSSMSELRERLRERMNAAQAMMQMLSPGQRADILSAMDQTLQDSGLMEEFQRLRSHLGQPNAAPMQQPMGEGTENISLSMGVQVLENAARMQQLENELRSVRRPADLAGIDPDLIQRVLDSDDQQWLDDWSHIEEDLEDHGLINHDGQELELTPRAVRLIGEKALEEVFSSLRQLGVGDHDTNHSGNAGELNNATRPWVFGDPLALDLPRTVMNAVLSGGIGTPVRLEPEHFEVQDREARTSTATALLIDMSRSMFFNGSWEAAKRSALALDTLIRGKYPRDTLELIGFSATAHPLEMTDLPTLEWNEYTYGTNLQHALQLAREKLASERGRNRQVIVITDGEPTAHISDGHVHFQHPTTPETLEATVREVLRCTRDDITITTFLLESDPRLRDFIEGLMQVNRGKVIAVSPNRLGSYVLRDFLTGRTKMQMG